MKNDAMRILIVDDESSYREVFQLILGEEGYNTQTAGSGEEAVALLKKESFNLVLTDLVMEDMDGIALLNHIRENYKDVEVIIVTGYGTVQNAVEAMKKGAYTYFIKSHDPEELLLEIKNLKKMVKLENDNELLREQQNTVGYQLSSKNKSFRKVLDIAGKAARSNSNILLLGESGVGKEVFARYIHNCSERNTRNFIPVNCHALSASLIESELFGHEKGAYTGAEGMRKGKFEAAHGSTLFLDEIGDMTVSSQVKLLRSLESKKIERIGSNKQIDVDFRLICATNRNLKESIETGLFRDDLFYRISTISIEIPPLRERKEDLPGLIEYFFRVIEKEQKKEISLIDDSVMYILLSYNYPGNVRELKNIIERLIVLSENGRVSAADLPQFPHNSTNRDILSLRDVRKETESRYIKEILLLCHNNITEAAEKLQMSRRQLFNKIQEYELK
jgi:two-component system, NtrC family, response regulator HydG